MIMQEGRNAETISVAPKAAEASTKIVVIKSSVYL